MKMKMMREEDIHLYEEHDEKVENFITIILDNILGEDLKIIQLNLNTELLISRSITI